MDRFANSFMIVIPFPVLRVQRRCFMLYSVLAISLLFIILPLSSHAAEKADEEIVFVQSHSEKRVPIPIETGPAAKTLRIRPQGRTLLKHSEIAPINDETLWIPGPKSPQEHKYVLVNAYSSQEFVHIDGTLRPIGTGAGQGTGSENPFHITVPAVDLDWVGSDAPPDEILEDAMPLWITDQTNRTFVVHCPKENLDDMFQWQNGEKIPDMNLLWNTDMDVYEETANGLIPVQSPYRIPRSVWTSFNKMLSFKVSRNKAIPFQDGIHTIRLEREHTKGDENANTSFDEIKYRQAPQILLKEVSFGGDGLNTILRDLNSKPYAPPHWLDSSVPLDGDADDINDQMFPVSYVSESTMSVSVKWEVLNLPENCVCSIMGQGPDGYNFPEVPAIRNGTELSIENVKCTRSFPRQVDFFDSMKINWTVTVAGMQGTIFAGTSENQVYVTYGQPIGTNLHHTVFRVGCENAKGMSDISDIFEAIWRKFKTRNIIRADTPNDIPLGYYRDISVKKNINSVSELLKNNEGKCGAWASFMSACIHIQGFGPCLVKEMVPKNDKSYPLSLYVMKNMDIELGRIINNPGISGQGTEDPKIKMFTNHALVTFSGEAYDPSYGLGPYRTIHDWETNSITGYALGDNSGIKEFQRVVE